jgi:hypothetical protein
MPFWYSTHFSLLFVFLSFFLSLPLLAPRVSFHAFWGWKLHTYKLTDI